MAGTATDKGTQTISYQYHSALTGEDDDKLLQGIIVPGIYSGGLMTVVSDSSVSLAPWRAVISDGTHTVNGFSSVAYTVTGISSATPYIVLRWEYSAAALWFIDVVPVAGGSILETDIVVGRCVYAGSTMTSINYSDRTKMTNAASFLRAEQTATPSMKVLVRAGWVETGASCVDVHEQLSATISPSVTNARIDLITVDGSGLVQVITGVEASGPVPPSHSGYTVLAEVTITPTTTEITNTMLRDRRPFILSASGLVHTTGIESIGGVKTFENPPTVPTPSSAGHATPKSYTDAQVLTALFSTIRNYGSSTSSGSTVLQSALHLRYGYCTVGAASSTAVTGLPFASSTSYVVLVTSSVGAVGSFDNNTNAIRNSGGQFTVYNADSSAGSIVVMWIAIGT